MTHMLRARHFSSPGARAVAAACALALVVAALIGTSPTAAAAESTTSTTASLPDGWRRPMMARLNQVRVAAGLTPVRGCAALRRTAVDYAQQMAAQDSFGHIAPDGTGPGERMRSHGYLYRFGAENIAAGQRTVTQVMDAWIASPEHYANILDPRVTHVGLGFAASGSSRYGTYWVQEFGYGGVC